MFGDLGRQGIRRLKGISEYEAGPDMPDSPPRGDDGHSSVTAEKIENDDQGQTGILNSRFDGERSPYGHAELHGPTGEISRGEGGGVVHQYQEKSHVEVFVKSLEVVHQRHHDKSYQRSEEHTSELQSR